METFILYTLKVSFCLSAAYILYFLLIRRETFHNLKRFVLLGIIIISLILPLVRITLAPSVVSLPVQKLETTFLKDTPATLTILKPVGTSVQKERSHPFNILMLIYLLGASVLVILVAGSVLRIIYILGRSYKTEYLGSTVFVYPGTIVPFCFGRRILISEKDLREHGREVILHEQTHRVKGHSLDLFISELFLILTWYNPVSWLIRHELKQNHEFEADRNVIRQGIDESDYQLLLLKAAAGETRFYLANRFNQSSIKTRIAMMNKERSGKMSILKLLFFLPLIALMVQVFAQNGILPSGPAPKAKQAAGYLELTPSQLEMIGFNWNREGLFYKNRLISRSEKSILCMYFTDEMYSASVMLQNGDVKGHDIPKVLKNQAVTELDFYPTLVASYKGYWTIALGDSKKITNQKLLPVQVSMGSLNAGSRKDTLIFWFSPTPALKQLLSPSVNIEDFIQPCPPDKRGNKTAMKSHS